MAEVGENLLNTINSILCVGLKKNFFENKKKTKQKRLRF